MKQTAAKRILSFVLVACMAFIGLITTPFVSAKAEDTWTLVTDASTLAVGDQVIIAAKGSAVALSTTQNGNNRGQAAIAKSDNTATINDSVQVLTLEEGQSAGTFAFNTGSGYLYAASSGSNYLRTETTLSANSSWKIEITSAGVATVKAQGTNTRNLLRYNNTNSIFSCYGSGQLDICLYELIKQEVSGEEDQAIVDALNQVDAYMSLAYKYKQSTVEQPVAGTTEVVFELGANGSASHADGSSATEYTETVDNYTLSITGTNMYKGARDAKGNSCIKLGTGSVAGSFTVNAPNDVTKVIISIAKYKTNNTTVKVNGTDHTLTKNSNDGEYDQIEVDTSSTKKVSLSVNTKRAMVNSITFVAENSNAGEMEEVTVYSNSEFRLKCGVDSSLADIAGVTGYGIRVSAGGKPKLYSSGNVASWQTKDDIMFVVLDLGDIINDTAKLETVFTVQAFVSIEGYEDPFVSELEKEYSVKDLVKVYYDMGGAVQEQVAHLYNILFGEQA